jgi:hypothetical protein
MKTTVVRARRFLSNVLAIAYKEASLLRHDATVRQNALIQPIMLVLVMGFGLRFAPRDVPWGVLDRSQSAASRQLVADIQTSGYFCRSGCSAAMARRTSC